MSAYLYIYISLSFSQSIRIYLCIYHSIYVLCIGARDTSRLRTSWNAEKGWTVCFRLAGSWACSDFLVSATLVQATQRLQCSSFLVMTYFLLRDCNILPKKELHSSLWVYLDLQSTHSNCTSPKERVYGCFWYCASSSWTCGLAAEPGPSG